MDNNQMQNDMNMNNGMDMNSMDNRNMNNGIDMNNMNNMNNGMVMNNMNNMNMNGMNMGGMNNNMYQQPTKPKSSIDFGAIMKGLLNNLKGMLLNPVDTAKAFIKDENGISGIIYMGISILLTCILTMFTAKNILSLVTSFGFTDAKFITTLYDMTKGEFNLVKVFLFMAVFLAIIHAMFILVPYVISKYLLKSNVSLKKLAAWQGVNSLLKVISYAIIVIFLLADLNDVFKYVLFFLCGINIYNTMRTLEHATETDGNKLGFTYATTVIATTLVLTVIQSIFK